MLASNAIAPIEGQREQEFAFEQNDFKRISALLRRETGIALPNTKTTLVYSRLSRRLRSTNCSSFAEYFDLISSPQGKEERWKMQSALTTNVTYFFREPHHFAHLRETVLPQLLETARKGGRVRIWSAACSSGEEPYSIALEILSLMPDANRYDIKILATDICPEVIEHAKRGLYTSSDVEAIPHAMLRRWFHLDQGAETNIFKVCEQLRRMVTFHQLNLVGAWPMSGSFQAIFCRNVVIYFDKSTTQDLWNRFAELLTTDGHLYIGHSERIEGPASRAFQGVDVTAYRKKGGEDQ